MKKIGLFILIILLLISGLLFYFYIDFRSGTSRVDSFCNNEQIAKISNLGTTKTLEILPLVDWYTDNKELKSEAGVSYLIKTDTSLILFDTGMNRKKEDPSPLMYNIKKLGVDLKKIDTIVISHNHVDHVGGFKWSRIKSFSLSNIQDDLGGKKVYTPVPMKYPGLNTIYADKPIVISKGVSTTGTIPGYLFFSGWTEEQALAVNVEGKGIVLIVGCGHQTLARLIRRSHDMSDVPIYGIVGGMHFPVTESRIKVFGLNIQKLFGTGKPVWSNITMEDVDRNIEILKNINLKIVALSAHDSCDATINAFRRAFTSAYYDIKAGEKIVIDKI